MPTKRLLFAITLAGLLATTIMPGAAAPVAPALAAPIFQSWGVAAAPRSLAVQSDSVVWITVPALNAIMRVQISAQDTASTTLFTVPTPNADPYDIAFGDGFVWFTERLGNKIGRVNPATGTIDEFSLPRAGSEPTGIAVLSGSPTRIWFAERKGNALGLLTVTDTVTFTFNEYPLPSSWGDAQPEGMAVGEESSIWFTAPGAGRLGLFSPAFWPDNSAFYGPGAGVGSQPWAVAVLPGPSGNPWLTERQGNRVGVFMPQTFTNIRWFDPPTAASDPYDLAVFGDKVGFVERAASRAALLNIRTGSIGELAIPGSAPTSIAFDANGCAWIAENGLNKIGRWCQPSLRPQVYLPLVRR